MPLQDQQWTSLLAISYNNRRTLYLYLITHSLDFDVLFFGMRKHSLHLLLQLCDSRLLLPFPYLFSLFCTMRCSLRNSFSNIAFTAL